MISIFKKKKIVPLIRLTGVIGSVGKFKQGIDFSGQEELLKKAFSIKKSLIVYSSEESVGCTSKPWGLFKITNKSFSKTISVLIFFYLRIK